MARIVLHHHQHQIITNGHTRRTLYNVKGVEEGGGPLLYQAVSM